MKWISFSAQIKKAIRILEKRNVTAEAFFTMTNITEVSIRNSQILTQNNQNDAGVGFRVAAGTKIGFACTNTTTERAILDTAEKALSIARVSSDVPHFSLPHPQILPAVEGLCDKRVEEATEKDAVDMAQRLIAAAEGHDPRVVAKSGRVLFQSGWRGILNTNGLDCEEKETKTVLYLGGVGEELDAVTGFCTDLAYSRTKAANPEEVGASVGKKVVEMFNPKVLKKFKGTVIFGPETGSYQLSEVLVDALKGENVMTGRSSWIDQVDEQIASEELTLTDNGTLKGGFSSRTFDDEGYPSQKTILIQNGYLKRFLHHATSARALKMENTGNASRFPIGFDFTHQIIGTGYRMMPEVFPSNLIIETGKKSREELISDAKEAVLIESMDGFPQAGSGIVSARLSRAFYIKNGEIQYPVKGMVSGIAFDWFKNITAVGNDAKRFKNVITPSLQVEGVTLAGS